MNCPSCGAANSDQAKFCLECGASLAVTPANCPSCNAPLAEGAKFCTACGTAVAPAGAAASTAPAQAPKAETPKAAAAPYEKPWSWEVTSAWKPIPHRQAARQLCIAAAAACVLGAVVAAIYPIAGEGRQALLGWLPPLVFLGCGAGLWYRQWIAGVVALIFWALALIASLPGLVDAVGDGHSYSPGMFIALVLFWIIVPSMLWGGIRGARAWQRLGAQPSAQS